jgi:hypothetical protein
MMICHLKLGWSFGLLGVGPRPSDGVRMWLRLKTAVDFIPHPYYIYRKYFSILVCYDWAYGCNMSLEVRVEFWNIGGTAETE